MEKALTELVEKLRQTLGANLKSVVLYGSAASGEFHEDHSDVNVLCVLGRLDAAELTKLRPAAAWWRRQGHPAPHVFAYDELHSAADMFAIELLDIQASRRVLFGEDVFAGLEVPMDLHYHQVERELRTNLIRLRQHYLAGPSSDQQLHRLMSEALSTFATLFRHALLVLGAEVPSGKRAVIERLSSILGFDPSRLLMVLEVREGKRPLKTVDAQETFAAYLAAVTRVTEEMDRRLAAR